MKTAKFILKEILYPASFLFTIYVFAVYMLCILLEGIAKIRYELVDPKVLLIGFAYLVIISAGNKIFKTELSMAKKVLINFSSYVMPFLAFLIIASYSRGEDATPISPSTIMVLVIIMAVIYAIIATPVLIIRYIINKRKEAKEDYKSQFDKI